MGHKAKECPTRQVGKPPLLMPKSDNSLVQTNLENSSSSIMLLSMPKVDNTGLNVEHEAIGVVRSSELERRHPRTAFQLPISDTFGLSKYCKTLMLTRSIKYTVLGTYITDIMHLIFPLSFNERTGTLDVCKSRRETTSKWSLTSNQVEKPATCKHMPLKLMMCLPVPNEREVVSDNILIKEEPPDRTPLPVTVLITETENPKDFDQVSNTLIWFIYNDSRTLLIKLLCPEVVKKILGLNEEHKIQISCPKMQVKLKPNTVNEFVHINTCLPVFNDSMTSITHLFLAQSVDNTSGTKEKQQGPKPERNNGDIESEKGDFTKTTTLLPKDVSNTSWRGIIYSLLIKEEPPDVPHRSYPNPTPIVTLGKFLDSLLYEDTNLLYFGTGLEVSRTKPSQGGGYDEDIRTKVDLSEETMHTDENIIVNDKEETINDASIVYEKAHGTTTTSERDCTVRTAGLDPDPIGDSGTFLVVGIVTPEESPSTCTKSQTTREQELCLNIHSETIYLKDFDRAKMHQDGARIEDGQETSLGTLTEPWKMLVGEYTRSFHLSFIIQQQTIHFRRNDRARTQLERSHLDLEHKSPLRTLTEPWKLPLGESTRAFSLYLYIHSKMTYFEGLGRAKLPKEPANWKESNLKQFGRFTLSEPTNPDRSSSSHALMFSNTNLKITCCFRMLKTASKPAPRISPRRSHLPYTNFPYLDQGAFKSQRPYSLQLLQALETLQDNQRLLRTRTFLPKLTRYKQRLHLPYLADFVIKSPTAIFSFNSAISFLF